MNKLIVIPLAILGMIAVIGLVMGMSVPDGTYNPDNSTGVINAPPTRWTMSTWTAMIAVLAGVVALAGAAGAHVFGFALSDMTQVLILKSALLVGIYVMLALSAWDFFDGLGAMGGVVMLMLTTMFIVGFGLDIRSGSA